MITFYQVIVVSEHYIIAFLNMEQFDGVVKNELQVKTLATPELDFFSIEGKPLARIAFENHDEKTFLVSRKCRVNPVTDLFIHKPIRCDQTSLSILLPDG